MRNTTQITIQHLKFDSEIGSLTTLEKEAKINQEILNRIRKGKIMFK